MNSCTIWSKLVEAAWNIWIANMCYSTTSWKTIRLLFWDIFCNVTLFLVFDIVIRKKHSRFFVGSSYKSVQHLLQCPRREWQNAMRQRHPKVNLLPSSTFLISVVYGKQICQAPASFLVRVWRRRKNGRHRISGQTVIVSSTGRYIKRV